MSGLTLLQRYYAINQKLNEYLESKNVKCPIIKYGIDVAILKTRFRDQKEFTYPYMQTYIRQLTPHYWTSENAGILTEFEYQLSFFTSPDDEFINDTLHFVPFEAAKNALSDITVGLLETVDDDGKETTIADLLSMQIHYEFEMRTGSPVPAAFLIAKFRAVCGYALDVPDATLATDIDDAVTYTQD